MTQRHLIVLGILILLVPLVWLADRHLLAHKGGFFPVDFSGVLIGAYGIWLALHIALSSLWVARMQPERLFAAHLGCGLAAAALLIAGTLAYGWIDRLRSARSHAARMEQRAALHDRIELLRWWHIPDAGRPQAIHARVRLRQPGRFAAHAEGRSGEPDDVQVFAGELDAQLQIPEPGIVDCVLPLTYYADRTATDISLRFYLFEKPTGPGAGDLSKTYLARPTTRDDGRTFYAPLPAPSAP
ncbi:MAG: hypothetical protein PHP86_09630 [Nevskiales bacterium]|nr:hypothetical protein [Nevskiales bacterium]